MALLPTRPDIVDRVIRLEKKVRRLEVRKKRVDAAFTYEHLWTFAAASSAGDLAIAGLPFTPITVAAADPRVASAPTEVQNFTERKYAIGYCAYVLNSGGGGSGTARFNIGSDSIDKTLQRHLGGTGGNYWHAFGSGDAGYDNTAKGIPLGASTIIWPGVLSAGSLTGVYAIVLGVAFKVEL